MRFLHVAYALSLAGLIAATAAVVARGRIATSTDLVVTSLHWVPAKPYLNMNKTPDEPPPRLLSETGAFQDVAELIPIPELLPYDVNVSFWSDGADKARWIAVPKTTTGPPVLSHPTENWEFPDGTVLVKHFELPPANAEEAALRIETRILVRSRGGGVHGATYKWRPDQRDAELVMEGQTAELVAADHSTDAQHWFYPGVRDCQSCHTSVSGGVLGLNTRQLNRPATEPKTPIEVNQLVRWSAMGLLQPGITADQVAGLQRLADIDNDDADVEHRVRSYLDVNCAMCHQPGGGAGYFDARFNTPLLKQQLVNGGVMINLGIDGARIAVPADPWRSLLLKRMTTMDTGIKMPPLGREHVDEKGSDLVRRWILGMPGPQVLAPPVAHPEGGEFSHYPSVSFTHPDPTATIRYTTNGLPPTEKSAIFADAIQTSGPVTIRAAAFKDGAKKSIAVTETYTLR